MSARTHFDWQSESFYDEKALVKEIRRVFDVCHTCRRCFNVCGLFPKLFRLLDSEEVDGDVEKITDDHIADIIPSCTLCDLCFITKCPYVPPHPLNIDFPKLMLQYRAIQNKKKSFQQWRKKQLARMDLIGTLGSAVAPVSNAVNGCSLTRHLAEWAVGIDHRADLPKFRRLSFEKALQKASKDPSFMAQKENHGSSPFHALNPKGPGMGKKVLAYITCFMNYFVSRTAFTTEQVLAFQGIEMKPFYPECCGMPLWEQGHLGEVAEKAIRICRVLKHTMETEKIDHLITLVPSCTLMLKSQWKTLCPQDEAVLFVAERVMDLTEYIVFLKQKGWLHPPSEPISASVSMHMACHMRVQHVGHKAYDMLSMVPKLNLSVVERCSGHGGLWGFQSDHFDEAMEVAKPVLDEIIHLQPQYITSECPMALSHIAQGVGEKAQGDFLHPIEIFAKSYGL